MAKNNTKIIISVMALTALAIILTATTLAAIASNKNLSTSGTVSVSANLGIYSDSACTIPLTSIAWGALNPGASTTHTIYIKNTGSGLSLTLDMTTSNWSSGANGPITLTWNQEGTKLNPSQSVTATLTATAASNITDITSFSVQVNIIGTAPS
jgi:hypothetical protein